MLDYTLHPLNGCPKKKPYLLSSGIFSPENHFLASQLCSHTIFHVLVQPVRADLQCWVLIRSSCQHAVRVYQNVQVSTRKKCVNLRCLCSARRSASQHLRPPSQTAIAGSRQTENISLCALARRFGRRRCRGLGRTRASGRCFLRQFRGGTTTTL